MVEIAAPGALAADEFLPGARSTSTPARTAAPVARIDRATLDAALGRKPIESNIESNIELISESTADVSVSVRDDGGSSSADESSGVDGDSVLVEPIRLAAAAASESDEVVRFRHDGRRGSGDIRRGESDVDETSSEDSTASSASSASTSSATANAAIASVDHSGSESMAAADLPQKKSSFFSATKFSGNMKKMTQRTLEGAKKLESATRQAVRKIDKLGESSK